MSDLYRCRCYRLNNLRLINSYLCSRLWRRRGSTAWYGKLRCLWNLCFHACHHRSDRSNVRINCTLLGSLLNDINHVCGTSFKTERQVWSQDLMSVAMADKDGEDPSYFQLMRSGASPDARGAYAFVFFFLLLISVLLSIFLQPHCFSFSFLTRRIKW